MEDDGGLELQFQVSTKNTQHKFRVHGGFMSFGKLIYKLGKSQENMGKPWKNHEKPFPNLNRGSSRNDAVP
jgi:hypothetical protein